MVFKAEVNSITQNSYQKDTFQIMAEGRWEGYETDKNMSVTLTVPKEKARAFRLGDGLEIRLLQSVEPQ